MSCGTALEARRNSDERWTFTPRSRNYTFSGMAPLFTVRRGENVLLQIDQTQTVNGSLFSVVGDSVVLQLKKGDAALLDGPTPDTDAEALFYDVTLTDQTGFENWIVGGPFTLLGLNDVSCGGCNETVEVTLGGQCIQINIEGGNLGIGASVNLAALNKAVQDAESAAEEAARSAATAATAGATAGAAAGSVSGAAAGSAAGATAGDASGTAAAQAVVATKADTDGGNLTPTQADDFRQVIDGVSQTDLASVTGLDLVGNGTNIILGSAQARVDVPIGNPFQTTYTKLSMKLFGDDPLIDGQPGRGFAFMAGVDNKGKEGQDNVSGDLVAGYFGARASPFATGDSSTVRQPIWAINALASMEPGSGTYNTRVAEFDLNNGNRNIGDADGDGFTSEVLAAGLEVFNSGFRSTAGVLINVGSDGSNPYNRGFAVAPGAAFQAGFADYSNAAYSYDSRGSHAYGLHFVGAYSNGNVLNGALSLGTTLDAASGFILDAYGAVKLRADAEIAGPVRISGATRMGDNNAPESGITLDVNGAVKVRTFLNVVGDTNLEGTIGVKLDGTTKAISVGAPDSGGTGFKVLRIAN